MPSRLRWVTERVFGKINFWNDFEEIPIIVYTRTILLFALKFYDLITLKKVQTIRLFITITWIFVVKFQHLPTSCSRRMNENSHFVFCEIFIIPAPVLRTVLWILRQTRLFPIQISHRRNFVLTILSLNRKWDRIQVGYTLCATPPSFHLELCSGCSYLD